jgi:hypothetical protein
MAKGLLLAMMPKGSKDSEDDYEDDDSDAPEPSHDEYGAELADILGVERRDRKDFVKALRGFVKACGRGADVEEDDE